MSKLNSDTPIVLDDSDFVLRANLKSGVAISRQFGGFQGAFDAIIRRDIEAYMFIIRQGIPKDARISTEDLNEAVFRTGIEDLIEPVIRFLKVLQNGGKVPKDEIETQRVDDDDRDDADSYEGNVNHVS